MPADSPAILVALDDDAAPALRYAVDAAGRAGCAVHLLHVVLPGSSPTAHATGERLLLAAAVRAGELAPGAAPRVSTELAHAGPVADVIVQRASRARQVVLQRRDGPGHGITERSTCAEVARRASCPVVLVPGHRHEEHEGTSAALAGLEVTPALPGVLP
jgi:nucleotide-binding universal stress UspA family protein